MGSEKVDLVQVDSGATEAPEKVTGSEESWPKTVAELGLDHAHCGISTGIHDMITAGQGKLDWAGFFEIECPECAAKWQEKYDGSLAPDSSLNFSNEPVSDAVSLKQHSLSHPSDSKRED